MNATTARALAASLLGLLVASVAFAHGPLHQRLRAADARVERSPQSAEPLVLRAQLHRQHLDYAKARGDLVRALRLAPSSLDAQLALADLDRIDHRAVDAIEATRAILAAHPDHAAAALIEARSLVALGRHAEATPAFDRALASIERPAPSLFLERFDACRRAHSEQPELALAGLDRAIARVGPVVSLLLPAIELDRSLGEVDRALSRIDSVARFARRATRWHVLRAELLLGAKRYDAARDWAVRAERELQEAPIRRGRSSDRDRTLRNRIDRVLVATLRSVTVRSDRPETSSIPSPRPRAGSR